MRRGGARQEAASRSAAGRSTSPRRSIKPTLLSATSRTWIDGEKIPATGGCIVVANHISHLDPLLTAYFVYDHGRIPRYLAKSGLFRTKFVGTFLSSADQIPVERLSRNAIGAYDAAVQAVDEGECVVVYPEGTLTRDPDLWPMNGKSGAARIALATGVSGDPGRPLGCPGRAPALHEAAAPRSRASTSTMKAGDPVPLDDLLGLARDRRGRQRDDRPHHGGGHRHRRRAPRRDRPRPSASTPAAAAYADRQPADTAERTREEAHPMTKIAVFSAGSWGTAFSVVLGDAGNDVVPVGPSRGGRRGDQRASARTPTTCRASSCRRRSRATTDAERGRRRRRRRRAHRAVADACGRTSPRGRRSSPRRPRWCR